MNLSTLIGLLACFLTTGAFLPQIIKTIKTKETKDISLSMYIIYNIGVLVWFVYGFMIHEVALLIGNTFSFIFGMTMLIMKIKYK
ncbi:MAG TPA: SemiSWEET transporter [Allocoleopsis sp.]